jgi:hypothetical protein
MELVGAPNPLVAAAVDGYPLQTLFSGTKLEHWRKECYMWITGDRRTRGRGERV